MNVLSNESLRLFDMDSIPNITNKEVVNEVKNIVAAYNAINMKINAIVKRKILDDNLSEFNHVFSNKNDSITSITTPKIRKIEKLKFRKKPKFKKRIPPLPHNKFRKKAN